MPAPYNVLFVCTGNACRSQMAEAILRHIGGDRFNARSAGSDPAGFVSSLALDTMARMGIPTEGQYSKSWNDLADQRHDIILTLCDHAAGQVCPVWPGQPVTAHWSLPDPSFHPGPEEDRRQAADDLARTLQHRLEKLIALPLDNLTPGQLGAELDHIAQD